MRNVFPIRGVDLEGLFWRHLNTHMMLAIPFKKPENRNFTRFARQANSPGFENKKAVDENHRPLFYIFKG